MSSKARTRKTRTTVSANAPAQTLRSVSDQTTTAKVRTDAEDKLWEALHANPNSTAADLSGAAKIGKSTTQKILVKWAAEGSVTRTAGIAEGGRRAADLWAITDVDTAQIGPAPVEDADTTDTEPEAPVVVSVVPDAPATDDATGVEGDPVEPTEGGVDATSEKKSRLAPGGLRGMVEDYLRDHPGEQFGPTAIANALGKSSGAVSNALDKLVEGGVAAKTQDKPRRFALAPSEQEAGAPTN